MDCICENCETGFFQEVFLDLQRQIIKKPELTDCCLIIDGMSIRKQYIFDRVSGNFLGYVDYGSFVLDDSEKLASEAIVFRLSGLKSAFKTPVWYFLISKKWLLYTTY